QFALCLVVKVLCGHFCIACLRPLTRRYVSYQNYCFIEERGLGKRQHRVNLLMRTAFFLV
ncbi:hypothetical protein F7U73_22695, partial [Vibrio vulnificus]|nr:hypothetical protein [Vibrio vulnificus]